MCRTLVLPIEQARGIASVREQCLELLKPYYVDPEVPLRYAFDHEATHVYLANAHEDLLAMLFARFPERLIKNVPLIGYMGLTATSIRDGGTHSARRLWRRYLHDARQVTGIGDVWVWYRTASPFGLYPCRFLLSDGEPQLDGGFSATAERLITELREYYSLPPGRPGDHPFVVRNYASARYSKEERDRISRLCKSDYVHEFESLAIDEQRGDRLLMIGRLP
jgi:hypothetical protein